MRAVTLQELVAWVKKNKNHTWHSDNFDPDKRASLKMKYITFSLDTRDMKVWSVRFEGLENSKKFWVRDDNEKDGQTILDVLQRELEK